jgi:hypothetical protein
MTKRYDWEKLEGQLLAQKRKFESISEVAKELEIPYATVYDAFERCDLTMDLVVGHTQDIYRDAEEGEAFGAEIRQKKHASWPA